MKKRILTALCALVTTASFAEVTYHNPDKQFEQNLNAYGAGVANWEEARLTQFTMADAHLYHYWAGISAPADKMPLKVIGGLDISKIMLDDVKPGHKISLYDVMRDRASIQNFVVMNKRGEIIAEDYWNGTDKETKNHLMSAHKSFTSMAFYIAEEKGFLKASDPVGKYVPEFKGTPWENIPLQNFADMTSGLIDLPPSRENYHWGSLGEGTTGSWSSAMPSVMGYNGLVKKDGHLVPPADAQGNLETFSDYIKIIAKTIKPSYKPGEVYEYKGFNTEILGVAIARSSGMNLAEFFDKYLWSKGGFNSDLALFVNQAHESAASGSANMTARDFAIGSYLMVNDGKNFKGEQILPKSYVDAVKYGDDTVKAAWDKVSYEKNLFPKAFYKNQWRTITLPGKDGERIVSAAIGVNGQTSMFDHKTGNIIAITAAFREPSGQAPGNLFFYQIATVIFDNL